jgi:membrane-bound lytic murein transglycosylase D
MSIRFCRSRVCAQRAVVLLSGLTVAAGCAGARPASSLPEPRPNEGPEAPIDLITSVATPSHTTLLEGPVTPAVAVPERFRDMLEPSDVESEFAHLFALDGSANVPPHTYQAVLQFVGIYSGRARASFASWLAREGRWGPMIREELQRAGMPEDLVYLSLVESGFSNTAVSRARAAGMWQFMEATARSVGLRVDEWVDERRDPQLATAAAISHLGWLHSQTQDWALAAAAYNAGLGRVNRIQKDAGEDDFFRLAAAGRLPAETRNYVPAILAAALIAHNRDRFGFGGIEPEPPFQFEWLEVEPLTRLSAVAKAAGSSERAIRELNPHLLKAATPPGGGYRVRIPYGSDVARTGRLLAELPQAQRLLPRDRWVTIRYRVLPGDGWGTIAQRHHTTVAELRKQNPRAGSTLHPGMKLSIRVFQRGDTAEPRVAAQPAPADAAPADAAPATAPAERRSTGPASKPAPAKSASHTVRSGETLSGIGRRYGISVADLARWNGMSRSRPLRVGERLRLTPPAQVRHTVVAGESLAGLARRYDVALADLMKWNGIARPRGLRIGEVLIVSAPG